jgi:hypothetical protein
VLLFVGCDNDAISARREYSGRDRRRIRSLRMSRTTIYNLSTVQSQTATPV